MIFLDAHVHVGVPKVKITAENKDLLAYQAYKKVSYEAYSTLAKKKKISKCLAFPFPFPEIPVASHNAYMLAAFRKHPNLFLPVLLLDSVKNLKEFKDDFYGVKDHFYLDRMLKTDRNEVLDFLQQEKKVYIFHAHRNHWIERISHLVKNFPQLTFIIAHAARPVPFSSAGLSDRLSEVVKTIPRKSRDFVYLETSTIRDPAALSLMIKHFGDEHILWGSDYPFFKTLSEDTYESEMGFITGGSLSKEQLHRIVEKNFRELFQKNTTWIRTAVPDDQTALLSMLDTMSDTESKYLALSQKLPIIKKAMKTGSHVYVAEDASGRLEGFLRESDRHKGGNIVEEVFVKPSARGHGIAKLLIETAASPATYSEAKTFASNEAMVRTLTKLSFNAVLSPKGTMVSWRRENEQ